MTGAPRTRPPVVLDCDPGIDDAFAILCALRYTDLLALTTVSGNVGLEAVTRNALAVLELAGAGGRVPVHPGADGPLLAERNHAAHVHGEGGLGAAALPPPRRTPHPEPAVEAILRLSREVDGLTLVAVGPLTNVALALRTDPGLADRLAGIVLMGGAAEGGNVTPVAEFNVHADPEAAAVVFGSGARITMVGLELTHQVRCGPAEAAALRAAGTSTGDLGATLLDGYSRWHLEDHGAPDGAMHDPCAVLAVSHPHLFGAAARHVVVELAGTHTRGMTVVDRRTGSDGAPPNASVAETVDAATVVALLLEATARPLGDPQLPSIAS
ncbi:MAG: nucleoside hydrolase [Acidimicrobiales bacterium]|jgi:inosine-uridine nucleoside N-ribohydrolase|nr:nucleoside hydrolase [Acidimicrobiales bacterium]